MLGISFLASARSISSSGSSGVVDVVGTPGPSMVSSSRNGETAALLGNAAALSDSITSRSELAKLEHVVLWLLSIEWMDIIAQFATLQAHQTHSKELSDLL